MESVVRETLDVLREVIVPWRRKHARERAELERRKLEAEIKSIETVRKVTEAKALRAEAEAGLALAESRKFQEETRAQAIANHRAELALNESQVDVARRIVDKLAPNAKPEERLRLLTGLHPPTKALCDSSVAIEFPDR